MKYFIYVLSVLFLLTSCTNKNHNSLSLARQTIEKGDDSTKYTEAYNILKNASEEEYNNNRNDFDFLWNQIKLEYIDYERRQFLSIYGKTKVAFVERNSELYIMNLDGTEKDQIAEGSFDGKDLFLYNLRWSPNGKYIVCNHSQDNSNLLLIDVESKKISWLTESDRDSWPSWSPDSEKVIFFRETGNQVISLDIDSLTETVLYQDWEYPPLFPFFQPNGKDIMFNRNMELQILKYGTTDPVKLEIHQLEKKGDSLNDLLYSGSFEYGCFSNSGNLFLIIRDKQYIFDINGKYITSLYGKYGTWSYDDKYIMYQTTDENGVPSFAVKQLLPDPEKPPYTEFIVGNGSKAVWSPAPPF